MSNIATALKEEIVRLSRKEVRTDTEGLKKTSTQYRSEIAALKRRVTALEKLVARLSKSATAGRAPRATSDSATRIRFSAKGLASKRQKLGLSAADLGALLNVSAQTIYSWESEKTRPRQEQLAAIASLRGLGKRQAAAKLQELAG
jgi:DNA-binding transcriptional regulator YiaG